MAFDNVKPRYGKEYGLVELIDSGRAYPNFREFKGIYLGFNSLVTPLHIRPINAEGYIFAAMSKEGDIEIYYQRRGSLDETWPERVNVLKFEGELKEGEIDYLLKIFNKHNKKSKKAF